MGEPTTWYLSRTQPKEIGGTYEKMSEMFN